MKITALKTFLVPPRWLFLKIETDGGVSGWGEPVIEGRALTVQAAVKELAGYLIGKDPRLIEDHWTVMHRGGFYRGGPIGSRRWKALRTWTPCGALSASSGCGCWATPWADIARWPLL